MFWVWLVVAIIILIAGFIMMFVFFDNEGEPDSFIEGLRIVSMFTAASWFVALLWPVLLVLFVPGLIVYGLWRLAVEGRKEMARRKEQASV